MTAAKRPILVDLAIILVLAAIAVIGYKYSPLLLPKVDLTVAPAAGCDIHRGSCRADVPGGGSIEFSIAPRPIPVVKPLRIEVTLSGLTAKQVELDFSGATMNMGYNRQPLRPDGDARFVGEAMIPVCVTGRMEWVATLLIETDRQRIAFPINFDAPIGR